MQVKITPTYTDAFANKMKFIRNQQIIHCKWLQIVERTKKTAENSKTGIKAAGKTFVNMVNIDLQQNFRPLMRFKQTLYADTLETSFAIEPQETAENKKSDHINSN